MSSRPEYLVQRPQPSFLTAFVRGATALLVTGVVCVTSLTGYGMFIFDKKTRSVVDLGRQLAASLPDFMAKMPPILADAASDRRAPDYAQKLEVAGRLVPDASDSDVFRAVIEVRNTGDKVISLLPLRVALVDPKSGPVREWTEYAATPIGMDDEWRGPLMPGATRQIRTEFCSRSPDRAVSCEISDLRVWSPESSAAPVSPPVVESRAAMATRVKEHRTAEHVN